MKKRVHVMPTGDQDLDGRVSQAVGDAPCVTLVPFIDQADIVVVVMGLAGVDYDGLRPLLEPALDGAFDVLGIHAPAGDRTIPAVMEDVATLGFYLLDPAALTAALCEGEIGWFDGGGGVRPERKTERHCR